MQIYEWVGPSAERRELVKQGKMKESEKIMAGIKDVIALKDIGPAKAEGIRAALVLYKGARAWEAGQISKEKYNEIYIQAQARFAELDQITDDWVRNNRAQNARNWARALQGYNDYLNAIQARQPQSVPAPSFPNNTIMDCYEQLGPYSKGTFDCYKR